MQMKTLIMVACSAKAAEHEDVDHRKRKRDKRQHEAEEQQLRQRVVAAEARHAQLLDGVFVGECPPQIQPVHDAAACRPNCSLAQATALAVESAARRARCLARSSSRRAPPSAIRALSGSPPNAGMTVKTVANTARPTSSATMKPVSKSVLTIWSVMDMAFGLYFEVHHLLHHEDAHRHQIAETMRMRWPVARGEERHDVGRGSTGRRERRR